MLFILHNYIAKILQNVNVNFTSEFK